jgi:hypothetical protein
MKKSLIAMALMFGAVVFAASCSKKGNDDPKMCTVKVVDGTNKVASEDYPNPVKESEKPTTLGTKDAAKYKNGSYVCE